MYNCDEADIVKFDADFDEDFDNVLMDIMAECKRIYFLNSKGFGIKAKQSNSKFNKSVDLLPSNLTHIKFGLKENKLMFIFRSLIKIFVGKKFYKRLFI